MPALQPPSVVVSSRDVTEMVEEGLRKFPLETGGVIMGFETDAAVFLTAIIGPGPRAVHRRRSFTPDTEWQSARVAEVYARSGRTENYLGDWHTHPRGTASVSLTDMLAARSIARYAPARCPRPTMLIIGLGGADTVEVAAYSWRCGLLRKTAVVT